MKLTPNSASTLVWTAVASLLVVAALVASYTVFFRKHTSTQSQLCTQAAQTAKGNVTPIKDALCNETK